MATALGLCCVGGANALVVTPNDNGNDLRDAILGSGVTPDGAAMYTGNALAAGTFTGGIASGLGFESGIILSTGFAKSAEGPNISEFPAGTPIKEDNGLPSFGDENANDVLLEPGDPDGDLDLISGTATFDAAILKFDFQLDGGTDSLFINFVFASDEYIDFTDPLVGGINDPFGFFIDPAGANENIALVPGTTDPISVFTINLINNPAFYRNNVANTGDVFQNLGLDLAYDGLTTVLTASITGLSAGTHTAVLKIADADDAVFGEIDSAVFIQAGTFSNQQGGGDTSVPEPASLAIFVAGLAGLGLLRRRRAG